MTDTKPLLEQLSDLDELILNYSFGGHVQDHSTAWGCGGCSDNRRFIDLIRQRKELWAEIQSEKKK